MADIQHVTNSAGRHRVAYDMALAMWVNSKEASPNLNDAKEFLDLVSECTRALTHHNS